MAARILSAGRLASVVPTAVRIRCRRIAAHHADRSPRADLTRISTMPKGKRTYQPNNRRRARRHGFRLRMRTRAGRAIIKSRRRKGRRRLTA
jgi:large subunit ribosomal protein L34